MYDATLNMIERAILLGVHIGRDQIDSVMGVSKILEQDWTLVNASATQWATSRAGELIRELDNTSRKVVREAVAQWTGSGDGLPVLTRNLEKVGWGFDSRRAKLIAQTETTKAYAEGNIQAWKASKIINQQEWRTANDELVCPICAPLGGLAYGTQGAEDTSPANQERRAARTSLGGSFTHPGGAGLASGLGGGTYQQPPAHPNCRCWLVPVVIEIPQEPIPEPRNKPQARPTIPARIPFPRPRGVPKLNTVSGEMYVEYADGTEQVITGNAKDLNTAWQEAELLGVNVYGDAEDLADNLANLGFARNTSRWGANVLTPKQKLDYLNRLNREVMRMRTAYPNLPATLTDELYLTKARRARASIDRQGGNTIAKMSGAPHKMFPKVDKAGKRIESSSFWTKDSWDRTYDMKRNKYLPSTGYYDGWINQTESTFRHELAHNLTTKEVEDAFKKAKRARVNELRKKANWVEQEVEVYVRGEGYRTEMKLKATPIKQDIASTISDYASTKNTETIAESFEWVTNANYVTGDAPEWVERFVREHMLGEVL